MRYRLQRSQRVAAPLETIFAFFSDPANLEALTPPWLGFRILHATDSPVRLGTRISYRLRLNGVPLRWESVIAEHVPGVSFADEQARGPYRHWYHRHGFRAVPGGVEIEDVVEYELPFGLLGRLAHVLLVRRQLRQIFDYRAARMRELFGELPPADQASGDGTRSATSSTSSSAFVVP
jgi:ligand-binding SRPBCC domain-containing protein